MAFKESDDCCWNALRVREHVLFQVMFPDEGPIAEVTLELLGTGVDEHV